MTERHARQITVAAIPCAQPRPRVNRATGVAYTPTTAPIIRYKEAIRAEWVARHGGAPPFSDTPLSVLIIVRFPRPKRLLAKKHAGPRWYESSKNDWDNLGKGVCDALNGLAWTDDGAIVDGRVLRVYADLDAVPSTTIIVRPAGEPSVEPDAESEPPVRGVAMEPKATKENADA